MNTKRVNAAAGVILAAQKQRNTAAGIAMALEAAGLLQSPESAAELNRWRERTEEAETAEGQLRGQVRGLKAYIAELEAQRERRRGRLVALQNDALGIRGSLSPNGGVRKVPFELSETLTPAVDWLINRVAELEAETADAKCSGAAIDHDETGVCNHAPNSPEDPHDSPLHHTYAVPRDLPEVCHCGHTALTHRPDGCIADAYHSGLLGLCGCMAAVTA